MLSLATINEFKEALRQEYGKDVSLEQAGLILADLVAYFDILAKVDYKTKHNV